LRGSDTVLCSLSLCVLLTTLEVYGSGDSGEGRADWITIYKHLLLVRGSIDRDIERRDAAGVLSHDRVVLAVRGPFGSIGHDALQGVAVC
jgi:hypothetical protein